MYKYKNIQKMIIIKNNNDKIIMIGQKYKYLLIIITIIKYTRMYIDNYLSKKIMKLIYHYYFITYILYKIKYIFIVHILYYYVYYNISLLFILFFFVHIFLNFSLK